ncbi:hypothetical protein K4K54_000560 [Colletotrichum sp. SAR 10_86]|nr:hypothetical protein K4K54_000560 [Colletotrichum sp. SAR 10_86]
MDPTSRKRKKSDAGDSAVAKRNKAYPVEIDADAAKDLASSFIGSEGIIHNEGVSQGGRISKATGTAREFKKHINSELDCIEDDAIVTGGFAVVYEGTDWDRGYEEDLLPEHDPVERAKIAAERREIRAERLAAARARKAAIKARNDAIEAAASNDAGHDEATEVSSSKTGAQPSTNLPKMGEYETRAPAVPVHTPAVPVQGHNYQNVWNHGLRIIQDITNFTRPPYYTRALRPDDLEQHETSKDRRSINERPAPGQRCGNCYHWGHRLIDCTYSPAHGAITGCPFCNTKEHNLDECIRILVDIGWLDLLHALLERRRGKCGIRTSKYLWMELGRDAKERKDDRFRSIKFDDRGPFPLTVSFVRAILKKYKRRNLYALDPFTSQDLHWVWYDYLNNLPAAVDPMTEDWRAVEDNYDELIKTEEHGHVKELKREKKEEAKTGLGKDVPVRPQGRSDSISAQQPRDKFRVSAQQPSDKFRVSAQQPNDKFPVSARGPNDKFPVSARGPNDKFSVSSKGATDKFSVSSKGANEKFSVSSQGFSNSPPQPICEDESGDIMMNMMNDDGTVFDPFDTAEY